MAGKCEVKSAKDRRATVSRRPASKPNRRAAKPQRTHPAPVSGWRRLAADWAAVGGSTLVCQTLAVATSLVLRGALSPSQMGVWQGLKLLLGYANYANLGVSKGAARELAIAAGSGQQRQAERGLNLAFTVNTITSVIYGICLAGAGLWLASSRGVRSPWCLGLLVLGALVVLQRHLTFHITILRCRQRFALTAWAALVEGGLTLLAAGLGAWLWGLSGLYGGTLLTMAGSLAFLHWRGVRPFRFGWDLSEIKRLISIGGPILLGGVTLGLFQSLDKLMLLGFSPDREYELGCYSTTLLITAQIYGLANMFALVVAPRYAELFGRTGTPHAAAALAARASEPLAAVASAAAVLGLLAAVPLLGSLFPDYRPGLSPALWLVPGVVLLALTLPLNQFLVAVGRERTSLIASIAALAAAALADYSALRLGYGMLGVAAATAIVYAAYYIAIFRRSIWPFIDQTMRRRYLRTHVALVAPIALAVCLTDVAAARFSSTRIAASLALVLVAWCSVVLGVWRRGAWKTAWQAEAPVERENTLSVEQKAQKVFPRAINRWLTLAELERRCQKPRHREVGSWMARRVARPLALRITWMIGPTGVSAHTVTCAAIVTAQAAAVCFGAGGSAACLAGALMFQVWYVLDHVDGQVARLRGTSSLDGVQLDYLMHHIVNLTIPCSLGYGLWKSSGAELWLLLGFAYAAGLLLLGLVNDTRSKAIIDRMQELTPLTADQLSGRPSRGKRPRRPAVKNQATANHGSDGSARDVLHQEPQRLLRRGVHLARKLCEIHVVMNVMTVLSVARYVVGATWLIEWYLAWMAPLALLTAVATSFRDIRRGAAERELSRRLAENGADGAEAN